MKDHKFMATSLLRQLSAITVLATGLTLGTNGASAREQAAFAMLDGVVAQCVISTNKRYAHTICKRLAKASETFARDADLAYSYVGTGREIQFENPGQFKQPIQLVFYVRGTGGSNVGASVRITAGINMAAAIDKSGPPGQQARKGFLVLWERAAVGNGPARKMSAALSNHMSGKMQELFNLLAAAKSP